MECLIFVVLLLAELNSRILAYHQIHMEGKKQSDQQSNHNCQYVRRHNEVRNLVIKSIWVVNRSLNNRISCAHNGPSSCHAIEYHAQEVFVVVKSDTVSDPGTMVVHLENASVALGAMVASIWLSLVAPLADSNTTIALLLYRNNDFMFSN